MASWQVAPAESASSHLDITEREIAGVRILGASGELDLAGAVELCGRVEAAGLLPLRSGVAAGIAALGAREG